MAKSIAPLTKNAREIACAVNPRHDPNGGAGVRIFVDTSRAGRTLGWIENFTPDNATFVRRETKRADIICQWLGSLHEGIIEGDMIHRSSDSAKCREFFGDWSL
jgi:hypothetical protein